MDESKSEIWIQSWYLNKQRLLERVGVGNLGSAFIQKLQSLMAAQCPSGIITSFLSPLALRAIREGGVRTLQEHAVDGSLKRGVEFTYEGAFYSKGLAGGKELTGSEIIRLSAKLKSPLPEVQLIVEFSSSSITTDTGRGALMGHPSVFVYAFIESTDDQKFICRPYIIGNLVFGTQFPCRYRDYIELRPDAFDAFAQIDFSRTGPRESLSKLKAVPETEIKQTFADALGEQYIPSDWGGEQCDLQTVTDVEGARRTCAFLFKGPSKFKSMELSHCGKNADQIVRLFKTGADVLILQHCHTVGPAVRETMSAFARSDLSQNRRYCIIDGYDTLRILEHWKIQKQLSAIGAQGI